MASRIDERTDTGYDRPPRRRSRRGMPARMRDHKGVIDWIGDIILIVLIILVIMFCISTAQKAYDIGYNIFHQESMDPSGQGTEVEVTITEGMSTAQIGKLLQEKGLIKDASVFPYQERLSSWHGKIVPGTYTLSTDMTTDDMLKIMSADYEESSDTSDTAAAESSTEAVSE